MILAKLAFLALRKKWTVIAIKKPSRILKMAGFRLRFDGQTTFDNKLNLNFRLGLPPLGIIGIPMNITGTSDKPKVKLGKSKEGLAETIDSTDVD
jgi:AsmA protein